VVVFVVSSEIWRKKRQQKRLILAQRDEEEIPKVKLDQGQENATAQVEKTA
jgi:hypothetical protein